MSDEVIALDDLQREFARFVTGLDEQRTGSAQAIVSRVRSDRAIPAPERLRVYADAYFARIHEVLREDYAALCAALGEAGFHDLVRLYLMAHPSRTFSLRHVGEHLPAFLSGPVAEPFARRWPFAADLAALEWALVDVSDAADAPTLERAALGAIPSDDWAGLRFSLVPAHRLLSLAWPVHLLREAWSENLPLPEVEPSATHILVCRDGMRVTRRALPALEARALGLLREGQDFGTTCNAVAGAGDAAEAAVQLVAMLERWLIDGVLTAAHPPRATDGT